MPFVESENQILLIKSFSRQKIVQSEQIFYGRPQRHYANLAMQL